MMLDIFQCLVIVGLSIYVIELKRMVHVERSRHTSEPYRWGEGR